MCYSMDIFIYFSAKAMYTEFKSSDVDEMLHGHSFKSALNILLSFTILCLRICITTNCLHILTKVSGFTSITCFFQYMLNT